MKKQGKKELTIIDVFNHCEKKKEFVFNNRLVKKISINHKFSNHHDATAIHNSSQLPQILVEKDYFIAHLGNGRHKFFKGIKSWYHDFEKVNDDEIKDWQYLKSLLNHTDNSESNVVSMAYNQGVIKNFLYPESFDGNPNIYLPRRTKINAHYNFGKQPMIAHKLQIEIDATFEYNNNVTIVEAKNSLNFKVKDFAIYQIFYPTLYNRQIIPSTSKINCCYLLQSYSKKKRKISIRMYLYEFQNENDLTSLQLVKKRQYNFKSQP